MTDPEDEAARFRTYKNYLDAFANFCREEHQDPRQLLAAIVSTKVYRKIQGGQCKDINLLARQLRNAWYTELQLHVEPARTEHVVYTNHWSPVQLYYAVFLGVRAFFEAAGKPPKPKHSATLRAISNVIEQRPELFPHPWQTLCLGGSHYSDARFLNLPSGVEVARASSLTRAYNVPFWDSYTMLLRTTRKRQLEQAMARYKQDRRLSRIDAFGRLHCVNQVGPTSIFDALYRLRLRSNYSDADSFLIATTAHLEANEWRGSVQCLLWYTMLVLELLICRYLGRNRYSELVGHFIQYDPHGLSENLVSDRFDLIVQVGA